MNFKNFKQVRLKNLWRKDFSDYQYPLVVKSNLYSILQHSWSYNYYIERLLSKSRSLSRRYYKEDHVPLIRLESAIYLKAEAKRIKQMIEEAKSKNMEKE